MDPVTIAGLVLGILPLLISAAENYEVTFAPFVTYCRHVKEIKRFSARLDAQHTIFKNECQLLLLEVDQSLADILSDLHHPSRTDPQLSLRLQELLGTSYSTCLSTLALINDTLGEVREETVGFREVLEGKKAKGKSSWTLFRQKIKISFSKTRLNSIVDELKRHNEDLGRISSQIRRLKLLSPQSSNTAAPKWLISDIQTTQQAATRLYDVLSSGWSCDDRVEHVATLSLRIGDQCRHSASKIRFNLAVTCKQTKLLAAPFCLAIESEPSEPVNERGLPTLPKARLQSALHKMGAFSRKVKFDIPPDSQKASSVSFSPRNAHSDPDAKLNLYTVGKLCRYFRQTQLQNADGTCIGFLEKTKAFKHFVYPAASLKLSSQESQSTSLKLILKAASENNEEQDWIEKLVLARILALSVLRFHSTPWISEVWSSNDIRFLSLDDPTPQARSFESPFVNVPLLDLQATQRLEPVSSGASSLASNQALFNLGVVLIELGYDNTFERLAESLANRAQETTNAKGKDVSTPTRDKGADFIAARRLGESVHRRMNKTYGRIVEKCLNCNFGVATKLDDIELQNAVVVHVVNQLEVCLNQWREFNTLAPCPPGPASVW